MTRLRVLVVEDSLTIRRRLVEVLAATVFAWLLLGQVPAPIQIAGAALVLAGVVVVKLGEPSLESAETTVEPLPVVHLDDAGEPVAA